MKEIVEAPIPTISDKQKDKESNDERLNPTKAVEPLPIPAAKERRPGRRRVRGKCQPWHTSWLAKFKHSLQLTLDICFQK